MLSLSTLSLSPYAITKSGFRKYSCCPPGTKDAPCTSAGAEKVHGASFDDKRLASFRTVGEANHQSGSHTQTGEDEKVPVVVLRGTARRERYTRLRSIGSPHRGDRQIAGHLVERSVPTGERVPVPRRIRGRRDSPILRDIRYSRDHVTLPILERHRECLRRLLFRGRRTRLRRSRHTRFCRRCHTRLFRRRRTRLR